MEILPICLSEAQASGNPFFIELYTINLRTGVMRIAATDEDVVFNGETYSAVPFKRGEIGESIDSIQDSISVTLGDCSYDLLSFVMNGFDFRGCTASIMRIKYPDSLTNPMAVQPVFSGFIDEPSFSGGQFTCKLVARMPEIKCPNRTYRLACNSEFGDEECGMSLEQITTPVIDVDKNTIILGESKEENFWKDGVITVGGESRIIISSSQSSVTVNVTFAQELTGKLATLIRGCNKTKERCKQYNNLKHYSGFPAIPFQSSYR